MTKPTYDGYHPWTTYVYAREEARNRGDRRVGTEHLLLGLLREPDLARVLGVDLTTARDALGAMDVDALVATLGASLEVPPVPAPEPSRLRRRPSLKQVLQGRVPFTPAVKPVLEAGGKRQPFDPRKVLVALLELRSPDPGAELLNALGVDRAAVRERVAEIPAPA
jgi:Clp amino terminal domain, pathogenicity island component